MSFCKGLNKADPKKEQGEVGRKRKVKQTNGKVLKEVINSRNSCREFSYQVSDRKRRVNENAKFKGVEPAIGDSDLARTIKVLYYSYCNYHIYHLCA